MSPSVHAARVLGVDEAGRGPIVGPLVMAAVALCPRQAARLTRAGVADSKSFGGKEAHARRQELAALIAAVADHVALVVVDVHEIDRRCRAHELNRLEQEEAARLIAAAPPARRIVCDGERLFAPLRARWPHLEARNEGEGEHVAVAAASIVAKVRRDQIWHKIARRYAVEFGDALTGSGGGYVNAATQKFLRAYIERYRRPPPEARRSWPWRFAADLLDPDFDPFCDLPAAQR